MSIYVDTVGPVKGTLTKRRIEAGSRVSSDSVEELVEFMLKNFPNNRVRELTSCEKHFIYALSGRNRQKAIEECGAIEITRKEFDKRFP